jgi:hypothetical protein
VALQTDLRPCAPWSPERPEPRPVRAPCPAQFQAFVVGQIAARWERVYEASRGGKPYSEQKAKVKVAWQRGWYQWAVWVGGRWRIIYTGSFGQLRAVLRYCLFDGQLAPYLGDWGIGTGAGAANGAMGMATEMKRFAFKLLQQEAEVPLGFRFVLSKSAAAAEKHALAYNHILNKQLQQSGYRFGDLWKLVEPNSKCSAQRLSTLWEEEFGAFLERV